MKVLVVLTQPPLPEGGAPGRCAVGLLRGLAAHGLEVTALAARQHFAVGGEPPADLRVEVVDVPPEPPGWSSRARRLRRPAGALAVGSFGRRVRELAAEADVMHLEEMETAWCSEGARRPAAVHIHYLVRRDRRLDAPWTRGFRATLELELGERAAIRRHRHLVASSPLIADALRRRAPGGDVVLAPLSLDSRYYEPARLDGPPTVGIIGTASWPPTANAIRRLLERVWPRVHELSPDARLRIAGRGTGSLGIRGRPGVDVVGEVDSGAAFLRDLSVLVYPLRHGSGMKVKVLEAIASGVPVVTTAAGAEGVEAGEGLVVHEDDEQLARATASILLDPGERRDRGAAARKAFLCRYAPEPAARPLIDLYRRMVEHA